MDRNLFIAVIVIGVIIVLVSIFAHQLGLGGVSFGIKKIAGVILGLLLIAGGIWGMRRQSSRILS